VSSAGKLARHIERHCKRARISLRELARLAGVSHPTVQAMAKGSRPCRLDKLDQLAKAMGVRSSELIE
jgi:transcriptional regulator with XRE-family HTH domain